MDKLKIMLLGFSGSGKTYLQGSWFKLSYPKGSKGFSLQPLKFNHESRLSRGQASGLKSKYLRKINGRPR